MAADTDLYKAHREVSDKYTYFLLAGAGAAIAFATTQTQAASLTWPKLLLAGAVLCWGISFFSGCRQVQEVSNLLQRNYNLLRVKSGTHPDFPNEPAVVGFIEKDLHERSAKSGRWGSRQFRFLIVGALFYIVWHISEMLLRTPELVSKFGL